jgi:hypothetical protein
MKGKETFLFASALALSGCGKIERPCFLPVLHTNEVTRVLERVRDTCPVSVAKTTAVIRPYGAIYLEWTVSTRALLMRASSANDEIKYEISGYGVEPYSSRPPSTEYKQYTHLKMFPGNDFNESPPLAESFSIIVTPVPGSGQSFTDEVFFQYDTVQCTCSYYDSL